jgi:hypothetical protein
MVAGFECQCHHEEKKRPKRVVKEAANLREGIWKGKCMLDGEVSGTCHEAVDCPRTCPDLEQQMLLNLVLEV